METPPSPEPGLSSSDPVRYCPHCGGSLVPEEPASEAKWGLYTYGDPEYSELERCRYATADAAVAQFVQRGPGYEHIGTIVPCYAALVNPETYELLELRQLTRHRTTGALTLGEPLEHSTRLELSQFENG